MTAPTPWPVPDAAVEAGGHAAAKCDGHIYAGWSELPEHRRCDYRRNARAAILAALPLLGIAELLEEAAHFMEEDARMCDDEDCGHERWTPPHSREQAKKFRDAAARMKGEA